MAADLTTLLTTSVAVFTSTHFPSSSTQSDRPRSQGTICHCVHVKAPYATGCAQVTQVRARSLRLSVSFDQVTWRIRSSRRSACRRITREIAVLLSVATSRLSGVSRPCRSRGHFASLDVTAVARGRQPPGWRGRKPQINRLFCKPICKPDAARHLEPGETEPTERDGICPVRRGQRTRGRRLETGETVVVWLITQRQQNSS